MVRQIREFYPREAWLGCLVITTLTTIIWWYGANTHDFSRRDAFDYAQMTRQVTLGHGLSTLQIFPRHIPYFNEKGLLNEPNWPNLYRNPLITITAALFQLGFQDPAVAMVAHSGFWYLASLPVLYFLVIGLANRKAAAICTVFYAADPVMLLYSYSGMTETLATFLLLCLCALAFLGESRPWKWFLLGLVSGLAYLSRAQFAILAPLVILYALFTPSQTSRLSARFDQVMLVLAGLLAPLLPWLGRNWAITGDPFFSFTTSRNLLLDAIPSPSDLEMQLHAPVSSAIVLSQYSGAILVKVWRNVSENVLSMAYWANTFRQMVIVFPLLAFSALVRKSQGTKTGLILFKWSVVVLILATFFLVSLTVYSVRSYLVFRPLILILAASEIVRLLESALRSPALRKVIIILILVMGVVRLGQLAVEHRNRPSLYSFFEYRTYQMLTREFDPHSLVASDISEQLSLYTGRRTLRLPADPQELLAINQEYLPVDYVLISKDLWTGSSAVDEPNYHETYQDYLPFIESTEFLSAYNFDTRLPNGAILFIRK